MISKNKLFEFPLIRKNILRRLRNHFSFLIMMTFICLEFFSTNSFAQPLASGKNKFVGNIISYGNSIRSNFSKYWDQVTAENAGKWGSVEGAQGSYNWTQLDNIYNYAVTNKFPYKHHCLVWGQQQPSFISTLDSASQYQEVENWIKLSGGKYPLADMCDVVNEPLHAVPSYKNALGGNGATGWDWVIKTFELARKYWPNTKLILNEYSVLNDGNNAANFIKIINLLKDRNLIDGIGIQAHNFEVNGGATVSTLKTNLDKIAATGLPIYISEFDINESNDATQLQKYQSIFPLLYEHPSVKGITLWGYMVNEIWQTNAYLINERNAERPALAWLHTYLAAPYRPVIISPNATSNESLTPKLLWHSSVGSTSYHIQVANTNTFTTIVLDTTMTDTLIITKTLNSATRYFWHVSSINDKGESPYTDAAYFITKEAVGVEEDTKLPTEFKLYQNYPNPFNPSTVISYQLPVSGFVTLKVYDVLGKEVETLVNEYQHAGNYNSAFSTYNLTLPSGVYFYRLQAGNFTDTKKFILLK